MGLRLAPSRRLVGFGIGVVAGFGSFAGCTDDERACTLVGMESSVGVEVSDTGWTVVEFCIDDVCPPSQGTVSDKPSEYTYRLTLRSTDGTSVQRDGVVRTKTYGVNGPGCAPETANALLVVNESGFATVEYLS